MRGGHQLVPGLAPLDCFGREHEISSATECDTFSFAMPFMYTKSAVETFPNDGRSITVRPLEDMSPVPSSMYHSSCATHFISHTSIRWLWMVSARAINVSVVFVVLFHVFFLWMELSSGSATVLLEWSSAFVTSAPDDELEGGCVGWSTDCSSSSGPFLSALVCLVSEHTCNSFHSTSLFARAPNGPARCSTKRNHAECTTLLP